MDSLVASSAGSPAGLKLKICLIGGPAVGKTSLIRRFVLDEYDDHYIATIGTKVSKKEVDVPLLAGGGAHASLMVWDVMGHEGISRLFQDAYFVGVQGILAVADLTRRDTFQAVRHWLDAVFRIAGRVPALLAVNKSDLAEQAAFTTRDLEEVARVLGCPYLLTSAKTGDGVEAAFRLLGTAVADRQIQAPTM